MASRRRSHWEEPGDAKVSFSHSLMVSIDKVSEVPCRNSLEHRSRRLISDSMTNNKSMDDRR